MYKFYLSEDELTKFRDWNKSHDCAHKNPNNQAARRLVNGAIGGRLTYHFTPNGLGCVTVIKCACGEECDVTDYDLW